MQLSHRSRAGLKLRYMHRNPVNRGLVAEPDKWKWSSYRSYAYGEAGMVRINCQGWPLQLKYRPVTSAQ
jgi:putative transposase